MTRAICQHAIDLIMRYEGFRSAPYQCAAGVWTIGYGSTYDPDGQPITTDTNAIDETEAQAWLVRSLRMYSAGIQKLITYPITDNQHGALVSFAYNVGAGNLQASTLRCKLNRGDIDGAADEFPKWRRAGGKILNGLVKRRAAEQALFLQETEE